MFTDSSRVAFEWDGDLAKLPPEIRMKFMAQLEFTLQRVPRRSNKLKLELQPCPAAPAR